MTKKDKEDAPKLRAVMITYNQALTEKVEYMLDALGIRGYTQWEGIKGRGSVNGQPHMGTHTWPEINSTVITVVEEEKVEPLLQSVQKLNAINDEVGIRAFVWKITETV